MHTSTDSPQFKYLAIALFINAAKVVQIERNTKENSCFLCQTALSGEAQGDLI